MVRAWGTKLGSLFSEHTKVDEDTRLNQNGFRPFSSNFKAPQLSVLIWALHTDSLFGILTWVPYLGSLFGFLIWVSYSGLLYRITTLVLHLGSLFSSLFGFFRVP